VGAGLERLSIRCKTFLRSVKEHICLPATRADKRQVLVRILREVGALMVQTPPLIKRWSRVRPSDAERSTCGSLAMQEVIKAADGRLRIGFRRESARQIGHVGIPSPGLVRNKAGKKTEFGLAYLIIAWVAGTCLAPG